MLKYNYIIAGLGEYYKESFRDVTNISGVFYSSSPLEYFTNFIGRSLFRINYSRQINKLIRTPFSSFVNPRLYNNQFHNSKPVCLIFLGDKSYIYKSDFLNFFKKNNPGCRVVLYLQDLVSRTNIDGTSIKEHFDAVVSYDRKDAERYGYYYHPTTYPANPEKGFSEMISSDVFYCGAAKNRYSKILSAYDRFNSMGLKCVFYVTGVPKEEQIDNGIIYNVQLNYSDYISHVRRTRALLEIMQEGADGYTPRLWESILYDKYLITDNISLKSTEYDDYKGLIYLNQDLTLLKEKMNQPLAYSYEQKEKQSAVHFLEFIDNLI